MDYRELDSNMTWDVRIETGSTEESERVVKWFRDHGHNVQRPWALRDYVIVRGSSYKLGSICEGHFPDMPVTMTLVSKPVGLARGEWVVMPRVGIVGTVAWEYGHRDSERTSCNVNVGSAMWTCGWADTLVRLRDLPEDVAAELLSIGQRQGEQWELLHGGKDDPSMRPDRERAFELAAGAVSA